MKKVKKSDQASEKAKQEAKPLHPLAEVAILGDKVLINQREYRIVVNEREALDRDVLREKYDPYLDQYDYLVGDVSSDHLRLRGFYNDYIKTSIDRKKSTIVDYLYEYCNPGAPYFILESAAPSKRPKPSRRRRPRPKKKPAFTEKRVKETKFSKKSYAARRKKKPNRRGSFVIRKKQS